MEGLQRTSLVVSAILSVLTVLLMLLFRFTTSGMAIAFFLLFITINYVVFYVFLNLFIFREIEIITRILNEAKHKKIKEITFDKKRYRIRAFRNVIAKLLRNLYRNEKRMDHLTQLAAFRKEFIADVSHELKTPIFSAQGFVHTLLDGAVEDKEVRIRFLQKAAKSLDSLDLLVHDLLTLSNIEIGETKMQFEYFDVNELIQEVVEQFTSRKKKKDVSIKIRKEERPAIVYADWLRIRQALTNLISNAIKYTNEGGKVRIEIKQDRKNVTIKVIDTGVGIPEKDLARVFERFYRVDKSRSRERGGTGLGLAIVKHIIEGHGSSIEVESKVGEGSTFFFSLPKGKI